MLEFIVKMKDLMSSGLTKLAQTSKKTFTEVQSYIDKTISKNRELEKSFANANKEMNNQGTYLRTWARNLGLAVTMAGALSFASSSVKAAMDFGATKTSFGVLTGSKQKGSDLANSLNTLQQNTILGPEVFKSAQTMLSFGVATEKVVDVTKQLGNVAMGNKDRFAALTLAYSQTQSAGKLMGQDLLQYINAGFNPLQTMSERWKEFGFTAQKSVGDLRAMMEKGAISSQMVAKAFEMATSTGGKFNNMMDAMAQTSYGKMQILQGQFEAFKISVGEGLMPAADSMMKFGNRLLNVLNLSKTAPMIYQQERSELNSLIGVITSLNEKNEFRKTLLQQLNVKYPDLFKNIDIEKVKNNELLGMLNNINAAYDKRIGFATSELIMGNAKTAAQEAQSEYTKYMTLVELMNRGDKSAAHSLRSFADAFNASKPGVSEKGYYQQQAEYYKKILDFQSGIITNEQKILDKRKENAIMERAYNLYRAPVGERMSVFGKDSKRESEFDKIAGSISKPGTLSKGWHIYSKLGSGVFGRLQELMEGSKTSPGTANIVGGDTGKSIAQGITGGGPRVININGVTMKVAENMTVNAADGKEFIEKMEPELDKMLLRLFNSGASVQ